jgi:hypothetical protein
MASEVSIDKSQAQMDDQFVREYMAAVGPGGDFDEFLDGWGMSEEEVIYYLESNPQILPEGYEPHYEGDVGETDGDDRDEWLNDKLVPISMNEDFVPDYSKTAEYEGEGITSEMIPGEAMVPKIMEKLGIPPEAAIALAALITKKPKGMFTPRKNKGDGLTDKRGTKSGEVVGQPKLNPSDPRPNAKSGQSMQRRYGDPDKNTKQLQKVDGKGGPLATTKATETRKFGLTDKNKGRAGAIATATAIGLLGKRALDGSLEPVADVPLAELIEPETMGNQFGYHKREGQNFWTVNNDDSYWDTHVMGTGDAWNEADIKEEVQELDWSSWFNR